MASNCCVVSRLGRRLILPSAALAFLGLAWFGGTVAADSQADLEAYERSFDGNCESLEDFLDNRPYNTFGFYKNPGNEQRLLRWGTEQGLKGLEGEIPLARRRQALDRVYRLIIKKYLPDAVVAQNAPDAGVKVVVGDPRIVMWAPEGKTADRVGNIAKLGHLGPTLKKEGRWGQYMFPEINRIRGGMILVRVHVGGDGDRNYLDYVSGDGGRNWTHFARYLEGAEMPSRDWAVTQLPDGEEIKVVLPTHDPRNIFGDVPIEVKDPNLKTYGGYYRLGDLPRELQSIPLYRRKPGEDKWTEEEAYLDPDLLVKDSLPNPINGLWLADKKILPDGSLIRADFKFKNLLTVSDLLPDGTFRGEDHPILRSFDRGRTWRVTGRIPGSRAFLPFCGADTQFFYPEVKIATTRAHLLVFPNGNWVASFRHPGLYSSGAGPLIIRKSSDQGKTWSKGKAIRMPAINPSGVVLENGIAVMSYQRPGVFFTFCADGKGDLWGNDITLVKAWKHERNQNSCCNGTFLVTGRDRFLYVYTKWDVPDPWGQPRQAVIAQEFIVSKK